MTDGAFYAESQRVCTANIVVSAPVVRGHLRTMRDFQKAVEQIVTRDNRYHRDAYAFVLRALDYAVSSHGNAEMRHIDGQTLLLGFRELALKEFSSLACFVLEDWGITCCEDVGQIVFHLVEEHIIVKRPEDSLEDFSNGFDFKMAFDSPFSVDCKRTKVSEKNNLF